MTEASFESKTELDPTIQACQQVDEAIGDELRQLPEHIRDVAREIADLMEQVREIPDHELDPRTGALQLVQGALDDADFHLRNGQHLAHPEPIPPDHLDD